MKRHHVVVAALFASGLAAANPHAVLPNGATSVHAIPMTGPFTSVDAMCKADDAGSACSSAEAAAPCGFTGGALTGAFSESRVLAGCAVVLHAKAGWYRLSVADLPAWNYFLNNGDRYESQLSSITASKDGKAALVRGVFIHDTNAAKMPWLSNAPHDNWYECEERLFVCAIGDSGPSCAGPFSVSYTTYCRDGEHVEKTLGKRDAHDFRFAASLDGTALTFAADKSQRRTAPLPGWAVTALDAPNTKDLVRTLSPEHVDLHFP